MTSSVTHSSRRRPYVRHRVRAVVCSASVLSVLGTFPAASAPIEVPVIVAGSHDTMDYVSPSGRPLVEQVLTLAENTRDGVESGSLADPLASLMWPGREPPVTAAPAHPRLGTMAALPAELGRPVAGLYAAVHQAATLLGDVSPGDLHRAIAAMRQEPLSQPKRRQARSAPTLQQAVDGRMLPPVPPYPDSLTHAIAAAPAAAAVVTSAIDRYLPDLKAFRGGPTGAEGVPCDLVDRLPYLCVSSEGNQVHTSNAMLLIDLGGADTYEMSAGGAPFVLPGGEQLAPVSVNIDLGGNDSYRQGAPIVTGLPIVGNRNGPTAVTSPTVVTQGAALFGTVGLLVDAAGDDSYVARAAEVTKEAPVSVVMAQGAGVEAVGGLFDLGGRDRYLATAPDGYGAATVSAQGSGQGECGAGSLGLFKFLVCRSGLLGGVLADRGGAGDEYLISAGTATGPRLDEAEAFTSGIPLRAASGQGAAWTGFGALVDDGGADSIQARASSTGPGHPTDGPLDPPIVAVQVQGMAQGGLGLLLTGEGDTRYSVDVHGVDRVNWHLLRGQGAGEAHGAGMISDLGGNDEYSFTSTVDLDLDLRVTGAESRVDHDFVEALHSVEAQGFGGIGSVGLLVDSGGNDRYDVENVQNIAVHTEDARTDRSTRLTVGTRSMPFGLGAQGAGVSHGVGYLMDQGGSDRYRAFARNSVVSEVTSEAQPHPLVTAVTTPAWTYAQGASLLTHSAGLLDFGGAEDSFVVDVLNPAQTLPNPDGAFQHGKPVFAHGAAAGGDVYSGTFLALGEAPKITSSPSEPTCQQPQPTRRGEGYWTYCGSQSSRLSGGFAPRAASAASTLQLYIPKTGPLNYDYEPTPLVPRLPVRAIVSSASGAPVETALVHFRLVRRGDLMPEHLPSAPLWGVHAITGPDGVAEARLPLYAAGLLPEGGQWSVEATYDGRATGETLLPSYASSPLTLVGE